MTNRANNPENRNCIQSARLAGDFASHANAALLIGTVKPPPACAMRESVSPEGRPQFSDLPGSLRSGYKGLPILGHQAAIGAA